MEVIIYLECVVEIHTDLAPFSQCGKGIAVEVIDGKLFVKYTYGIGCQFY